MQNLTTSQLRDICAEYVGTDSMSRADYEAHVSRVLEARAELKRRKNATICIVKIEAKESCEVLQSFGWTIGVTDENFAFAWKRPNELTKHDKKTFVIFYT